MNSIQDQERKATDETVGKLMRRSATEMKTPAAYENISTKKTD